MLLKIGSKCKRGKQRQVGPLESMVQRGGVPSILLRHYLAPFVPNRKRQQTLRISFSVSYNFMIVATQAVSSLLRMIRPIRDAKDLRISHTRVYIKLSVLRQVFHRTIYSVFFVDTYHKVGFSFQKIQMVVWLKLTSVMTERPHCEAERDGECPNFGQLLVPVGPGRNGPSHPSLQVCVQCP